MPVDITLTGDAQAVAPINITLTGDAVASAFSLVNLAGDSFSVRGVEMSGDAEAVDPKDITISGNAEAIGGTDLVGDAVAVPPVDLTLSGDAVAIDAFSVTLTGDAVAVLPPGFHDINIDGDAFAVHPQQLPTHVPNPQRPCAQKLNQCLPCNDDPLTNLSAEDPDLPVFCVTATVRMSLGVSMAGGVAIPLAGAPCGGNGNGGGTGGTGAGGGGGGTGAGGGGGGSPGQGGNQGGVVGAPGSTNGNHGFGPDGSCTQWCCSTVSEQDAYLCALALAQKCALDPG